MAAKFFSKDNFDKLARNIKSLLPVLKTSKDILQEEFGLTEIQGVGFLQDFRIYSKIKPENWANASTFTAAGQPSQLTAIQSNNMSIYSTGVISTNNAVTAGTSVYFMATSTPTTALPSLTVYEGPQGDSPARPALTHEVEIPAPTEAIEAGVVDEKALLAPVQVLRELERVPNAFTLMDIDKKAALYESVAACVRSDAGGGVRNTLKDVQRRVKARCKYRDSKEVRKFFDQFQTTSCDSIDALLDRHKHLKIGPADDFIPEMPDDALEAMVLYTKMCVKVTGEKPCFYLIAPDRSSRRKGSPTEARSDPARPGTLWILLADPGRLVTRNDAAGGDLTWPSNSNAGSSYGTSKTLFPTRRSPHVTSCKATSRSPRTRLSACASRTTTSRS